MRIEDICRTNVVYCSPETSIIDAAKLMRAHHVGDLVVAKQQGENIEALGIVTDRDLVLEVLALDIPIDSVCVKDIMSRTLVFVDPSKGVYETLQIMRDKGIRRMPVINEQDNLIGIVTLDDLLETIAEEMGLAAKLIAQERDQEREHRPLGAN